MEKIKKQVKLITKKVSINDNESIIVPDESVNYNFKISLTKTEKDFGFFDTFEKDFFYGYYYPYNDWANSPLGLDNLLP